MANDEFITRIFGMYQVFTRHGTRLTPLQMREMAPGIVASCDEYVREGKLYREYNVYADSVRWSYTSPSLWEPSTPLVLEARKILFLTGDTYAPQVRDFLDATKMIQCELRPRIPYLFYYAKPVIIQCSP